MPGNVPIPPPASHPEGPPPRRHNGLPPDPVYPADATAHSHAWSVVGNHQMEVRHTLVSDSGGL
ncbi:hypothetical protein D3C72_411460 [compost metagenome]